jgi:predicted nucleic acid-binding protein
MPVLFVDTSALLRRYLADRSRPLVIGAMADPDAEWCASALTRSEVLLALHQAAGDRTRHLELWRAVRNDWEAFWEIPVDGRCLARAAEIGAVYGLRTVDAVQLAAADRLPRPVRYLTFDRRQIPAADGLGFEVVSAFDP